MAKNTVSYSALLNEDGSLDREGMLLAFQDFLNEQKVQALLDFTNGFDGFEASIEKYRPIVETALTAYWKEYACLGKIGRTKVIEGTFMKACSLGSVKIAELKDLSGVFAAVVDMNSGENAAAGRMMIIDAEGRRGRQSNTNYALRLNLVKPAA